eukprot:gene17092-20311_t
MNNFLTGSVPPTYGESSQLQNLLLESNFLSVSLPEMLRADAFPVLFALGLSYNFVRGSVSGTLPAYLQYLDLAGVHLNGTVPVELLQSATLLYLALQANALTGTLPPEVFTTSIARVFLNDNALRGPFPSLSTVDNCTAQYLSLSNNALTGRLPAFLSRCKALTSFVASSLQLARAHRVRNDAAAVAVSPDGGDRGDGAVPAGADRQAEHPRAETRARDDGAAVIQL